jgi:hypothetical protein
MILKNDKTNMQLTIGNNQHRYAALISFCRLPIAYCLLPIALLFTGCYSFKDIGQIPKEVKTFRVNYIEN